MTIAISDPAAVENAASEASQIDTDQLVTATYRAVLGRPADPSGLQSYGKLFRGVSLPQGLERVVRGLLTSPEFQSKRAVSGERSHSPADPLQIRAFTPEEAQWVSSLGVQVDRVLVARFRLEPGSRPTIRLRDPSLLTVHRVSQSLTYLETLICKYLLHSDHYYAYCGITESNSENMTCILQIKDDPRDAIKTIGYSGMGSNIKLIPDLHFWISKGYFNLRRELSKSWIPWKDRVPRVFWRGASTGTQPITLESLSDLPRFRLCAAGADITIFRGVLDAKLTNIVQTSDSEEAAKIRTYLDKLGLMSNHVPQTGFLKYRFQIDIDGNSNSWSFLPKLMMGSCVLKVVSEWRQWYYNGLRPWEHYIPIKSDLSDLEACVAWCLDNDDDARQIGESGMRYANGIVFGTEMLKAAGSVLRASREELGAAP